MKCDSENGNKPDIIVSRLYFLLIFGLSLIMDKNRKSWSSLIDAPLGCRPSLIHFTNSLRRGRGIFNIFQAIDLLTKLENDKLVTIQIPIFLDAF
jgi:hypothetical protein